MVNKIIRKIGVKKENTRQFITSLVITLIFFIAYHLLGERFGFIMGATGLAILLLILAIILIAVELAVVKSLFFVAAELSLLIFLAQSYCDIPKHTSISNEALKNLLAIGLLYIIFTFCQSLYKELRRYYARVEKAPWSKEKIITVSIVLIFAGLFIWQIYLVVNPIILDLCIYK